MITMSDFGTFGGLGNQLFQYASILGISVKTNQELALPQWKYGKYFSYHKLTNVFESSNLPVYFKEKIFEYDKELLNNLTKPIINIKQSYLQSYKYFENIIGRSRFEFVKEEIIKARQIINVLPNKETIAIHVRRGDYVNNPNYIQLSYDYYMLALLRFKDLRDYNIIVFSDDIDYCKTMFNYLSVNFFQSYLNILYATQGSDIEDLILMTQCNHFITANSTYSWWGAYLGEKENSIIIRPKKYFAGELTKKCSLRDFYPNHWITEERI